MTKLSGRYAFIEQLLAEASHTSSATQETTEQGFQDALQNTPHLQ